MRIPTFIYLTDFRENTSQRVIVGMEWLRYDAFQPNGGTRSESENLEDNVFFVNRSRPTTNRYPACLQRGGFISLMDRERYLNAERASRLFGQAGRMLYIR